MEILEDLNSNRVYLCASHTCTESQVAMTSSKAVFATNILT